MSILGVGLDLCDIRRIRRAMENPRFAQRAFTQGERERIAQRGEQTAAGLFAAKEAVAKALGTGFDGFSWTRWRYIGTGWAAPIAAFTAAPWSGSVPWGAIRFACPLPIRGKWLRRWRWWRKPGKRN